MQPYHSQIGLNSWGNALRSILIVIISFVIVQFVGYTNNFYSTLLFVSGGFVWLPVVLSYVILPIKNQQYSIQTIYRCALFLIAGLINLIYIGLTLDFESASLTILVYAIGFCIQVLMIIIFNLIIFLPKKSNPI